MRRSFIKKKLTLILTLFSVLILSGCIDQTQDIPYNPSQQNNHHGISGGGSNGHSNDHDGNPPETPSDNDTDLPVILSNNTVSLLPEADRIFAGQSITIDILCEPVQPIKAWELTIAFDPLYLQAIDVEYGTFFKDFLTFPSPNTRIDNELGRITHFYSLILGPGNTTDTGILANIQFKCIYRGLTSITIESIGLTNETMYLPVMTNNCTINIS